MIPASFSIFCDEVGHPHGFILGIWYAADAGHAWLSCGACIHVAFQRLDATESEHELAARMEFITGESQFWSLEAELPL
jgi:hypothetical protein